MHFLVQWYFQIKKVLFHRSEVPSVTPILSQTLTDLLSISAFKRKTDQITGLQLLLSRSVVSDSVQPHRRQAPRLPCPWGSPDKSTGVGCHCLLQCVKVKSQSEVAQSCPTLCDPIDRSPAGCPVPGVLQARALERAVIAISKSLNSGPQMQTARPQPRATISETLGAGPSNPNFNKLSKALSMVKSETHWCISSSKKDSTLNHFFSVLR